MDAPNDSHDVTVESRINAPPLPIFYHYELVKYVDNEFQTVSKMILCQKNRTKLLFGLIKFKTLVDLCNNFNLDTKWKKYAEWDHFLKMFDQEIKYNNLIHSAFENVRKGKNKL